MERVRTVSKDVWLIESPHEHYHFVYLLKNIKNGRIYVGHTQDMEQRYEQHFKALRRGTHTSKLLQQDFDNGSEEDFVMEVIDKCICYKEAQAKETLYMVIYRTYENKYGYNGTDSRFLIHRWDNRPSKFLKLLEEHDKRCLEAIKSN